MGLARTARRKEEREIVREIQQDKQCTYKVTSRRIRAAIIAVEKQ
jgi:hypothetical protein